MKSFGPHVPAGYEKKVTRFQLSVLLLKSDVFYMLTQFACKQFRFVGRNLPLIAQIAFVA